MTMTMINEYNNDGDDEYDRRSMNIIYVWWMYDDNDDEMTMTMTTINEYNDDGDDEYDNDEMTTINDDDDDQWI